MRRTGPIALPGIIALPEGRVSIPCVIHEMSGTGAHLKVASPQGVPPHFTFVVANDEPRKASVLWWDVDAIGIRFQET